MGRCDVRNTPSITVKKWLSVGNAIVLREYYAMRVTTQSLKGKPNARNTTHAFMCIAVAIVVK
jgi:hypothetical protein